MGRFYLSKMMISRIDTEVNLRRFTDIACWNCVYGSPKKFACLRPCCVQVKDSIGQSYREREKRRCKKDSTPVAKHGRALGGRRTAMDFNSTGLPLDCLRKGRLSRNFLGLKGRRHVVTPSQNLLDLFLSQRGSCFDALNG
ncbi:hypothetical protein ACLOJK_041586 [Asimina triloba]